MTIRKPLLTIGAVLLVLAAGAQGATIITFDDVALGTDVVATNPYLGMGARFSWLSGNVGVDFVSNYAAMPWVIVPAPPAGPSWNTQFLTQNYATVGVQDVLVLTFVNPSNPAQLMLTLGSSIYVDIADTEKFKTVRTLGAGGNVIETLTLDGITPGPGQILGQNSITLHFTQGEVQSIQFIDAAGNGLDIDNIIFQEIPEPGTWLATASGLLGLVLLLRRRK